MLQGKAIGGALLLLLLGGCAPSGKETRAMADAPGTPPTEEALQSTAPASSAAGVKVFIDPATGLQRAPTEQEWATMVQEEKLRKESGAPAPAMGDEMILSDGTRGYVLGEKAKTSTRVCKGADGTTTVGHDCPQANDAGNGKAP